MYSCCPTGWPSRLLLKRPLTQFSYPSPECLCSGLQNRYLNSWAKLAARIIPLLAGNSTEKRRTCTESAAGGEELCVSRNQARSRWRAEARPVLQAAVKDGVDCVFKSKCHLEIVVDFPITFYSDGHGCLLFQVVQWFRNWSTTAVEWWNQYKGKLEKWSQN